jgi:hypothetical protein
LVETLAALAVIASVTAALLPALALTSRLHRDSAIETEASVIGAGRLEVLAAAVSTGVLGAGGRVDMAQAGWSQPVDRAGAPVALAQASYESRWQVVLLGSPGAVHVVSVRVVPLANPSAAITLSTAVGDE